MQCLIVLLVVNFLTCIIVRVWQGGRLVAPPKCNTRGAPKAWLIAGLQSQPKTAYQHIDFPGYDRMNLRFSNLGFSPNRAGVQLCGLVSGRDVVCGVSLGAKVIECAELEAFKMAILINPFTMRCLIRSPLYFLAKYVSPVLKCLFYVLGWIAIIPIVPVSLGEKMSLALLADQFFWCIWCNPQRKLNQKYKVVVSIRDELLDNMTVKQDYDSTEVVEIDTLHGRIASTREQQSEKYNMAILRFLTDESEEK